MSGKIKAKRTTTAVHRSSLSSSNLNVLIATPVRSLQEKKSKQRGPAYVAHLENKIDELKAKLQASQSHDEGSAAAHGIVTPPSTSCSAPDSSPEDNNSGTSKTDILEPAASVPLDNAVERMTATASNTQATAPTPDISLSTWPPLRYDEQFEFIEPPLETEMDLPLGNEPDLNLPAFDQSLANDWAAFDSFPPTIPIKQEQDLDSELFDFQMHEAMEQPTIMNRRGSNNMKRSTSKDRTELRHRNRIAAAKCRSRNKAAHEKLEFNARALQNENSRLSRQLLALRTQRSHLQELALQHDVEPSRQCQCQAIHQYNRDQLGQAMSWGQ
ncbi:hypothetical protein PRZ48_003501 [Zasmidium cellare]|uniref:BZIP domain-containing protein n=1 Tax=Zasmidium cellare TaxID=395010 RepID=A0ABR0EXF8_ZASCE|nr:hypothetical protein PRZ48_003501 [Zasmidium cellare]